MKQQWTIVEKALSELLSPMNRKHYTNIQVVAKKPSGGSKGPKGPKPPRITLSDVMNTIKELDSKLTARLDKVDARLDNLENEVHSQFKAHGWTK